LLEAKVPASVQRIPASAEDNDQNDLELRALGRKLGAKGWLYATAPAKYGGDGLDVDHAIILEEEVDRFDRSLPRPDDGGGARRRPLHHQRPEDLRRQREPRPHQGPVSS
jgi:alkylation response protein AidB-like acyl-CoA dehydrogenase